MSVHTVDERSKSCLSNFHILKTPIIYDQKEYITSEHLYQSLRYLRSNKPIDLEYAEMIRKASTPTGAKLLGNQVIIDCGSAWKMDTAKVIRSMQSRGLSKVYRDKQAIECMKIAVTEKIQQNEECLKELLALSKEREIVYEGDEYWGISYRIVSGSGPNAWREYGGFNHLGKILTQIRNN